jgi:hypothetical protein
MCEKCSNIYLHESDGRSKQIKIIDSDGIVWIPRFCKICGTIFCIRKDKLAGRIELSSINKKQPCIYPG